MRKANPYVVPPVFVNQVCAGNAFAALAVWRKERFVFNGFAPWQVWDHPERLMTDRERMTQPVVGAFALASVRSEILRSLVAPRTRKSRLTDVGNNLPVVNHANEDDPVPVDDFWSLTTRSTRHHSRHHSRHRSRPRGRAYRPR